VSFPVFLLFVFVCLFVCFILIVVGKGNLMFQSLLAAKEGKHLWGQTLTLMYLQTVLSFSPAKIWRKLSMPRGVPVQNF
jgi:ABC-type transport system involved in multi-copper enzyme maturation permease subunit